MTLWADLVSPWPLKIQTSERPSAVLGHRAFWWGLFARLVMLALGYVAYASPWPRQEHQPIHAPWVVALYAGVQLAADLTLLRECLILTPHAPKRILAFLWMNPLPVLWGLLFARGDLPAVALSIMAIRLMLGRKVMRSAAALGMAALLKPDALAILPVGLIYLNHRYFKNEAQRQMAFWTLAVATLAGPGLMLGWPWPPEWQLLATRWVFSDRGTVFAGAALLLAMGARLGRSSRITPAGFVFSVGVLFLLLCVAAGAPLYGLAWCLPIVALFMGHYAAISPFLLWGLQAAWVAYAAADGLGNSTAKGLAWTSLEAMLLYSAATLWGSGVRYEAPLRQRIGPLFIGVAGDSGAGKNVLSAVLGDLIERSSFAVLEGDDYHKWERGHARWHDYTHLHPRANRLTELAAHTQHLTHGRPVVLPHYDHGTGKFTAPRPVYGPKLVVVQGLHTFHHREMREHLHLKIFLAPHPLVRLAWKLRRDVTERGYPKDRVLESFTLREEDARTHIAPQKEAADWVIEVQPETPISREWVLAQNNFAVTTRHTVDNDTSVSDLILALRAAPQLDVVEDISSRTVHRISFTVSGSLTAREVSSIGSQVFPNLKTITQGSRAPAWRGGQQGVQQLIALALLQNQKPY